MVSFSTASNFFDYISLEGTINQAHVSETSVAFKGLFLELPAKQYNAEEVAENLKVVVKQSLDYIGQVLPLLTAVHAELCLQDRPRAVDFEYVTRRVKKFMYPHGFGGNNNHAKIHHVAIYFAMAYHSLSFVRMNRSPFVAVSSKVLDAIDKVMFALTRVELDHGVAQLLNRKQNAVQRQSQLADLLQTFLDHWALWNDPRLARAAEAVLEECEGKARLLDTPRALGGVLNQLSSVRLFPWLSTNHKLEPPGSSTITSSPSNSNSNSSNNTLHLRSHLTSHVSPRSGTQKTQSMQPRIFTSNLVRQCVLLDNSTAVNIEEDESTLNIFIPHLPQIPSILGKMSPLGIAARSVRLQGGRLIGLHPPSTVDKFQFRIGSQCSALRLSVKLTPRTLTMEPRSALIEVCQIIATTNELSPKIAQMLTSFEPNISDHEKQLPVADTIRGPVIQAANINGDIIDQRKAPKPHNEENTSPPPPYTIHAQAAAGQIAGAYMQVSGIEAPFLITSHGKEVVSNRAGYHSGIHADAYVPISRPFDSTLSLLAQRQLFVKPIAPYLYSGKPRPSLVENLRQTILPQLRILEEYELRDLQYHTLRNLQTQLQTYATFHIFRCILLDSSIQDNRPQGQIVRAFCLDLGIQVEVFVPPHTEQVFKGDQVIATEILELDPLQGLFVVSM